MSDRLEEVLRHRYVYLPRGETKDTLHPGKLLGLAVARARGVPLTVLAPQKNSATIHSELAKLEIVTERSGRVSDGGVVLAWCPRYKTMEKAQHLEKSAVVLVEWIPGEFEGWAKLNQAYNVVTGEVMDAALARQPSRRSIASSSKDTRAGPTASRRGWSRATSRISSTPGRTTATSCWRMPGRRNTREPSSGSRNS